MMLNLLLGFAVIMGLSSFFVDMQANYGRTVEIAGFNNSTSALISFGELNKTIMSVTNQSTSLNPIDVGKGLFEFIGVTFNLMVYGAFSIMKVLSIIPTLYSSLITGSVGMLGMIGMPEWVSLILLTVVQLFVGFEFLNMMRNTNKEV